MLEGSREDPLTAQVNKLTACTPFWLLYVSKNTPNPVKKSLLPSTGPVCYDVTV